MSRYQVANPSTLTVEPADRVTCPRCKGHGGKTGDEGLCVVCGGDGEVIRNQTSGATRRVGSPVESGQLY